MKEIILTIDYEIYFGEKTGSVAECMIEPTKKLLNILDYNNSKMTVFWDILHYYKLLQLENKFSVLKKERLSIQTQIVDMVKKGHDVQLHLHPHWLDARYEGGRWIFIYDRFKLHTLSKKNDSKDINTIVGCITITKNLMENVIRKIDKNYSVNTFRAGGYLIEPFIELRDAFIMNDIFIDSSVCPELKNDSNIFSFNFTRYPNNIFFKFQNKISEIDKNGIFAEIPITTFRIPFLFRIYFKLLKKYKYKNFQSERKGFGSESKNKHDIKTLAKLKSIFVNNKYDKLTTDDSFKEKYNYLLFRAKNYSTQILHPKMLNEHAIKLLKSKTINNKIKFMTINEFISKQYLPTN